MIYQLYTTIDITETKVYHGNDNLLIYQQQNFNTIIQTIGLCGNIYYDHSPIVLYSDKFYGLKHWMFEWRMEIPDLFKRADNHTAILDDIFQFVPYIKNLTEECSYDVPIFIPSVNIIFDYQKPYGIKSL